MSGSVDNTAVYVTDTPKQVSFSLISVWVVLSSCSHRRSKTRSTNMPSVAARKHWSYRLYSILRVCSFSLTRFCNTRQRKLGADVSVDVSCEWLLFFLESDERLATIVKDYGSGAMLTGEVKKELIGLLTVIAISSFKAISSLAHFFLFRRKW